MREAATCSYRQCVLAVQARMLFACCFALLVAAAIAAPGAALAGPTVTLEPASGPPGTSASIEGVGFGPGKSVVVKLGRRTLKKARTTRLGSFESAFEVPAVRRRPLKIVSGNGRARVSNTFQVTGPSGGKTGEVASRRARLRWTLGGAHVDLQGFGFPARRHVQIRFGATSVKGGRTNRRKQFSIRVAVPPLPPGRHPVRVRSGSTVLAFDFTVAAAPSTPSPATALGGAPPSFLAPDLTVPPAPAPQPTLPIRAAFYYSWFPETWRWPAGSTPDSPNFTKYNPSLGFYNSDQQQVRLSHLRSLEYARFEAGIYSWWGQTHNTNRRFPAMLQDTNATGSPIKWALYHEREGSSDPSVAEIGSDLDYIKTNYTSDPAYLKVGGKPVIFVYAGGTDDCLMASRWVQANTAERGFYVVLKVFPNYRPPACASQPDSWHQYAPSRRADRQPGYSFAISPEFDLTGPEPARLLRDLAEFQRAAGEMIASGEPWQLVISFNEWGENTATEEAQEWASPSGHGLYLDVLAGL